MHENNGEPHEEVPPVAPEVPDEAQDANAPQSALALDDDERLPWLESADDDADDAGLATARLTRLAIFGAVLLATILAALWFVSHRSPGASALADGSVIKAPAQPYKEAPKEAGGKTYAGTGDTAFAVSEGKNKPARLGDGDLPAPSIAAGANAGPDEAAAAATGVGVQVGAYSSLASAEAGWTRLAGNNAALKGLKHRVIEGSADIGTVYRLQALAADLSAANALCTGLKSGGVSCQVKN